MFRFLSEVSSLAKLIEMIRILILFGIGSIGVVAPGISANKGVRDSNRTKKGSSDHSERFDRDS